MTRYAAIDVYTLNSDGTKTPIADAEVKVYKASDNTLLATLTTDANGVVWPFDLAVPAGTAIYYEYVAASVHYRGGQGVTSTFLYQDIVVSATPTQSFYPSGNVEPAAVEVYVRESANPNAAWRLHERYALTAIAAIPVAIAQNRAIEYKVVSIAPDGTRSVSEVNHAPGDSVDFTSPIVPPPSTYDQDFGDGFNTTFTISHGLDSTTLSVNFWDYNGVSWSYVDANTIEVTQSPAPSSNHVTVIRY